MKDLIASTSTVQRLLEIIDYVSCQPPLHPRMILFSGISGAGKTVAAKYLLRANPKAVYYCASPKLTVSSLANELLHTLTGESQYMRLSRVRRELIDRINQDSIIFIIDEADFLSFDCLEFLRSIHDACHSPLVLIGMSEFYIRLKRTPQLLSRMQYVACGKCDKIDAQMMRKISDVEIAEDLIDSMHASLNGNLRDIAIAIGYVEQRAIELKKTVMTLADWGNNFYLPIYRCPPSGKK